LPLPFTSSNSFLVSPMRTICPAHLSFLDFITTIILRDESKLWSTTLRRLPQSPVISSLLNQNILLSIMFSFTLNILSSLWVRDPSFTPIQNSR
jgi:hypothetical protein